MTGEDMIIKEAAELLSKSRDDEHIELRSAFRVAGRCDQCAAPGINYGETRCERCRQSIVGRGKAAPEPPDDMLRFRNVLPLWRWVIVVGDGAGQCTRSFVAPRAEDALVMYRTCNPFDGYLNTLGVIRDIRCERLPEEDA